VRAHYGERGDVAVLNAVGGLFFHLGKHVADNLWGIVGRLWGTRDLLMSMLVLERLFVKRRVIR
jgi:hypothetical protein